MANTSTTTTACTLDCPDSCSLSVTTEEGRITDIAAGPANVLTSGFICSKVRGFADLVYHPTRVGTPKRRRGAKGSGDFEDISWDDALSEICQRLAATRADHGGEAILPVSYGGSNGLLTQDTTDARLFRRLGTSRLLRTVCAAPSTAAATGLYGAMAGVALDDFVHSRLIVLWGVNPSVSGIHLVPVVREAQHRGARLVVIDPRRTALAKKADLHIAPRPGTDIALALAIHHQLFERELHDQEFLDQHCHGAPALRERARPWTMERAALTCGIEVEQIDQFVDLYASSTPAVVRCGWGVERNRNGGSAVAAIIALPAVAGKFGTRGGGYTMSNSGPWKRDARLRDASLEPEPETRAINMNHLGRELLEADPKVRFLFVYNCNPLVTMPQQGLVRRGLERDDLFTVVFDPVMTDTARFADIVLPATTFMEHEDLAKGYGAMLVHRTRPVIEPVGESRSNPSVFAELVRRLGLDREQEPESAAQLRDYMIADDLAQDTVLRGHGLLPVTGDHPIQFQDSFPATADGKVDLLPEALDREAPLGLYGFQHDAADGRFPLALISPANNKTINSTMAQVKGLETIAEINVDDARERSLPDPKGAGARVRVWNEHGSVVCAYRISAEVRPGVVVMPKGAWLESSSNGWTANALVPDSLTDLGGGACFNDTRVDLEPISLA